MNNFGWKLLFIWSSLTFANFLFANIIGHSTELASDRSIFQGVALFVTWVLVR